MSFNWTFYPQGAFSDFSPIDSKSSPLPGTKNGVSYST